MPFGIIDRTGPGMRQVVGFGDQSTGRGTFGSEFETRDCNQRGLYGVRVWQCLNRRFGVVRAVDRGIAVLDGKSTSCNGKGRFWGFLFPGFTMENVIGSPTTDSKMFPTSTRKLDNISIRQTYRWKPVSWAFRRYIHFQDQSWGLWEISRKSNDCSTKTYAALLAATSSFRTGLRLALAMCAGLAHSVSRSWCDVINSPSPRDHFRGRYQTAPC